MTLIGIALLDLLVHMLQREIQIPKVVFISYSPPNADVVKGVSDSFSTLDETY